MVKRWYGIHHVHMVLANPEHEMLCFALTSADTAIHSGLMKRKLLSRVSALPGVGLVARG